MATHRPLRHSQTDSKRKKRLVNAKILDFVRRPIATSSAARARAIASITDSSGEHWTSRHLAIVLTALSLLQADDAAFAEQCRLIEPETLVHLSDHLLHLAGRMTGVAEALLMTVDRLRSIASTQTVQHASLDNL